MWRGPPWVRSTVNPVWDSSEWVMRSRSTCIARKRSTAISPSWSRPTRVMNPTFDPRAAKLCAVMAEELPRVTSRPLARSSCSRGSSTGSPYRIRSRLISPAMVMSKLGNQVLGDVVENHDLAQVAGGIGIKSFLQPGVKSEKLAPGNAGSESCALHAETRNLNENVRSGFYTRLGFW